MSGFIRSKQAGIQTDFSAGIVPDYFNIDEVRTSSQ
jgi:hypothetical protein